MGLYFIYLTKGHSQGKVKSSQKALPKDRKRKICANNKMPISIFSGLKKSILYGGVPEKKKLEPNLAFDYDKRKS